MKRNYIISAGGLGNQLFILAAAHYVWRISPSRRIVVIHAKHFRSNKHVRDFWLPKLHPFCEHPIEFRESYFFPFLLKKLDQLNSLIPLIGSKFNKLIGYRVAQGPDDYIVLKSPSDWTIVRGFFQNVEMILEIEQIIKLELLTASRRICTDSISGRTMVQDLSKRTAIHIRRGDFLENSETLGIIDLKFYEPIFKINTGMLLVASDDVEILNKLSVEHDIQVLFPEEYTALETLFILSKAARVYSANSTLSWWAALVCIWNGGEGIIPNPFYRRIHTTKLQHPRMTSREAIYE